MIVQVPGVGNVEFPDGTDPSVIENALAQFKTGPELPPNMARAKAAREGTLSVSPEAASKQAKFDAAHSGPLMDSFKMGRLDALGRGALQGLTFGFGDEAVAAIRPYLHSGETYDSALADQRTALDQARTDRPGYAYGGEIAGGIASGMATGGNFVNGAKTLPRMIGRSAALGAGEGALYGFGSGEGGIENRLKSGAISAVIGGGVGAAAPALAQGIKLGYRAVTNPIAAALNVPSPTRAARGIYTALKRSGMTADDVQRAIDQAGAEGQGMFTVADALGPSGQGALNGTVRTPGAAKQEVADFLTGRQGGQGDRLGSFMAEALGSPDTAAQRTAALTAARGSAANAAYDAARTGASPVDIRGALGVIDDRLGPMSGGMGIEGDGIDSILSRYRGRLAVSNPKNGVSSVELSDFSRVLGVKQDLADEISKAVRSGEGNKARELAKLKDALDQALEAASPAYRGANDEFAKASRVIDAVDMGKASASARVRAADTVQTFGGLTPEQQAAFRSGYSDPVIGKIESSAPGVNKARPLMNEKAATELGAIATDPELLNRRIGREDTMFKTANTALGGSQTANNLADIQDAKGLDTNLIMNILTGKWGQAGTQLTGKAIAAMDGKGEATRQLMARALLSRDINAALNPALKANAKADAKSALLSLFLRQLALRGPQMVTQK